jgi:hypothetical protein
MLKHSFQKKFYYKRDDSNKNTIYYSGANPQHYHHLMSPKERNKLSVGDKITFFGKLYNDKEHKEELATSEITYKISKKISDTSIVIETVNKYCFNNNNKYGIGEIIFHGKLFSPNFDIKIENKNKIICSYNIEPSILLVKRGTKNYKDAFGYAKYNINENGIGEIIMIVTILQ